MKKSIWIGLLIYVLYLALIVGVAFAAHLDGAKFAIFVGVMGVVGAAALVVSLIYKRKAIDVAAVPAASAVEAGNLDTLVRSADAKLKSSAGGGKSLASMPLVYFLGDENSAKTQTVLQSGLDPELLAGQVHRDNMVAPTQLANLWYTGFGIVVEAGGTLLRQPGLWARLVRLTQPNKYGAALSKGGLQPTRAAVVCVSIERLSAANSPDAIRGLGQMLNERLRLLSQTLGISLPIYILFTKLDTIPSFADYAANLTEDEARQPLGAMLARIDASAGLYGERAIAQATERFDELAYSLGEFRTEILTRGGAPEKLAKAYEFPRELSKLRSSIADFLVEVGRPSQLGVNPFLRGFYFSGIRAQMVDDVAGVPPPTTAALQPAADAGATRIFSFNAGQAAAPIQPLQRSGTRRVPQWVFLPYLLPRIVLGDRTALDTSRASTRVNVLKRVLVGALAACLSLYFVCLTISYLNNSALDARLRSAASMTTESVRHGDTASIADLRNLEQLRQVFAQIATYRTSGTPLFYSFGLYGGEPLYRKACSAYSNRFRSLLLTPTQANIVSYMSGLPPTWDKNSEYTRTYRPLRAYLISTTNPDKATPDVAQDFADAWGGNPQISQDAKDLALPQFQTYVATLPEPNSCMAPLGGSPRMEAVTQARNFLRGADGSDQVYLSMKAAANRKFSSINFNRIFPSSAAYIVDSYVVEGAFSKDGFKFMQDAIQHPEPYASGEEWVLGFRATNTPDIPALRGLLAPKYLTDYLNAWRTYLKSAHVLTGGDLVEVQHKLHMFDSPSSPLMQLFQVISQNTAVPNDAFSKPFQAPQTVVAANATTLPSGYINGLSGLDTAIVSLNLTPGITPPPAGLSAVIQAAAGASSTVNTVRDGFNPDPTGNMDSVSEALLQAPIKSAAKAANDAMASGAGGGAKALCTQLATVLNKFPFNPESRDEAAASEVAAAFQPGTGAFAQYVQTQTSTITLIGNQFMPAQGATISLNPAFLRFMSAAQTVSSSLFSTGTTPQLSFNMAQESAPGLPPATVEIEGTALNSVGTSKLLTWTSQPAATVKLSGTDGHNATYTGPWSLFHFAYDAKHPAPNKLEIIFQINGKTDNTPGGVPLDYKFDVAGPASQLLNPAFMHQLHCTTKVAQ